MITHTHHINPKHMGGSDDPSNLIELTVSDHAEAHRVLFEQYGRWEDELAWKGLAGIIGNEEVHALASAKWNRENNTGKKRPNHSEFMKDNNPKYWLDKKNPDHSERMTGEGNHMFGKTGKDHQNFGTHINLGKPQSKRTCPHCGKSG